MTRRFSGKFTEEAFLSARAEIRQGPTPRPDCHGASPASLQHASGRLPPLKVTAARFARAVKLFADSEVGWKAKWMFGALLALLCGANGLTVANSYVGRNFMTAIAERHSAEFVRQAMFYVAVFAASTLVAVQGLAGCATMRAASFIIALRPVPELPEIRETHHAR